MIFVRVCEDGNIGTLTKILNTQEAKKKVQARSAQAISREEANQDLQGRAGDVSSNNRL